MIAAFLNIELVRFRRRLVNIGWRAESEVAIKAARGLIRAGLFVARGALWLLEAMFEGGRLVREIGPGMRPEERYEFEKNYRDQIGGGRF
jgi:hypothetical protein